MINKFFGAITWLFTLLTGASLVGQWHWLLDLASHYHLQYTIGLGVGLLLLLIRRAVRWPLLIPALALGVNLWLVVPFLVAAPATAAAATQPQTPLRVMALNISTSNAGYDKVVALIRERQPDFVFMSEVREDLLAVLRAELTESYPYLHAEPSRMTLGIAFLSRQPFLTVETVKLNDRWRRYLRAQLEWQGEPVTIVGIHPLPPMNGEWAASRDGGIALMGELANTADTPFILLGDLNASPWSQPMRRLMATTDLRYALQGYGVWPTWHLAGPLLGAPLDYVLVSPHWTVIDYVEGGDIGSDHLPIQADLVLGE